MRLVPRHVGPHDEVYKLRGKEIPAEGDSADEDAFTDLAPPVALEV